MRVVLIGDVHGCYARLRQLLEQACRSLQAEAAIQVGDFGLERRTWGRGQAWPRFPIPVHALCGNHDDHAFLAQAQAEGLDREWIRQGLHYQPRGSLAVFEGVAVGFVGGALHANQPQEYDRQTRTSNMLTTAQVAQAVDLFARARPAVLATHSCPSGIGIGVPANPRLRLEVDEHIRRPGYDPGPDDDCGDPGLLRLWNALPYRPHLWFFGHFHLRHERMVEGTRFISLPIVFQDSLTWWDTCTGEVGDF